MGRIRILVIAAAIGFAVASGAAAQAPPASPPAPETLQAAKDLVDLISRATAGEMTSEMSAKVWPQIEAAVRAQYPKIDRETLGELQNEYGRLMSKTVAEAMSEAPPIYARYFTAAEMKEIAVFYGTPTGAKALTVMPKAMADITPALIARIGSTKEELDSAFAAVLKKHGYQVK